MPFPGERLAPRGNPKSWERKIALRDDAVPVTIDVFTNNIVDRVDVSLLEGDKKRRIFEKELLDQSGESFARGLLAGYKLGMVKIEPLKHQPNSPKKRKK